MSHDDDGRCRRQPTVLEANVRALRSPYSATTVRIGSRPSPAPAASRSPASMASAAPQTWARTAPRYSVPARGRTRTVRFHSALTLPTTRAPGSSFAKHRTSAREGLRRSRFLAHLEPGTFRCGQCQGHRSSRHPPKSCWSRAVRRRASRRCIGGRCYQASSRDPVFAKSQSRGDLGGWLLCLPRSEYVQRRHRASSGPRALRPSHHAHAYRCAERIEMANRGRSAIGVRPARAKP